MKPSPSSYESALIAVLKPQFYISRVFGLAPFTKDLQPSRLAALYSIVLIVLIPIGVFACNFGYYFFLLNDVVPLQTFITQTASTTASGVAALLSVWTALTMTRSNLMELHKNLYRVDVLLARGNELVGYLAVKRVVFIETCLLWFFFALSCSLSWSALQLATLHFYVALGYYLSVNYITLVQFFNFVHYIGIKYNAINVSLESMFDSGEINLTTEKSKGTPLENVEILPYHVQKGQGTRKIHVAPRTLSNAGKLAKIKDLRQAHYLLQIVIDYLNKIFGLRMVGLLMYLLVDIITGTYLLLKGIITLKYDSAAEALSLGFIFVTCTQNVLMLLTITVGCHLTMEEVHHTPTLVQQLLLAEDLGAQLKQELQQFAQQMLSSRPVFTASGLFDLDISLLLGVSASVATYTVILMTA